jgi:hypothetical protein
MHHVQERCVTDLGTSHFPLPYTRWTGVGVYTTLRAPLSLDMRRPEPLIPRRPVARLVYACGLSQLSRAEMPQDDFIAIYRHTIGCMVSIQAGFIPERASFIPERPNEVVGWTCDIKGTYDLRHHILMLREQTAVEVETQIDFGDVWCTIVNLYYGQ